MTEPQGGGSGAEPGQDCSRTPSLLPLVVDALNSLYAAQMLLEELSLRLLPSDRSS